LFFSLFPTSKPSTLISHIFSLKYHFQLLSSEIPPLKSNLSLSIFHFLNLMFHSYLTTQSAHVTSHRHTRISSLRSSFQPLTSYFHNPPLTSHPSNSTFHLSSPTSYLHLSNISPHYVNICYNILCSIKA